MINKIRKVILLITAILFACHLQVAGKELFVSKQSIPDFKYIFDKLSQNRIIYNRYNDSIFSIHNHDEWVRFFMTRSRKNHKIYQENEKLLNSIADYFKTDMADTTKETILPDAAYDSLNVHFFRNYAYALTDPFITNRITDILIRNFKNRQDQNYYFLRAMSWKGSSYYQIWRLNGDNETLKKAYDCIAYVADSAHCHTPEELGLYGYALQDLCLSAWTLHHIQPLKKLQERYEKLEELARTHTADELEVPETRRLLWINRLKKQRLGDSERNLSHQSRTDRKERRRSFGKTSDKTISGYRRTQHLYEAQSHHNEAKNGRNPDKSSLERSQGNIRNANQTTYTTKKTWGRCLLFADELLSQPGIHRRHRQSFTQLQKEVRKDVL